MRSSTESYVYTKDMRESTINVVGKSGTAPVSYNYTDYGETEILGDQDFYNEVCYGGGIYDETTGLYYLNARYYSPENAAFLTQEIELLEAENRLHKHTISTANVFSESWAKQINAFANDVINKGAVQEASWNRRSLYENVCISCKEAIKKYKGIDRDSDISVGFIEYSKGDSGEEYVELVAHSNLDVGKPISYENKELVSDCSYYYAKIIRDKDIDIKIATNNSEVRNFLSNVSIHTDLSQYEQYILIPVFCSNRKLMGMLQIVTKYGVTIMDEKYRLKQFVDNNIVLYSNLFVLIEKIAKGLYAKPLGGEGVDGKK